MAEIAVERKSRFPWWAWLLVTIAFLLLLWMFLAPNRAEMTGNADRLRTTGEPIRDAALIYNADDAASLVGRSVQIDNARVLSVTGDKIFWVGAGEDRQVLVVLEEVPTPNQPLIEGRYDVNPGQTLNINGRVERFPGWEAARSRWNVDPQLRAEFESQPVYIHAESLNITAWQERSEPVEAQPKR